MALPILPSFIFLGRIGQRKGAFDLIHALDLLAARGVEFRAVFAGDGELERARIMVKERPRLTARVELAGWQSKAVVHRLLGEAWALVLPSYAEGLPMAILEAMAAHRAVIATDVGDVGAAVVSGTTGYLVVPGDVEALTDALEAIATNRSQAEAMGSAGQKRQREHFAEGRVLELLVSIYLRAAQERSCRLIQHRDE